MLPAALLAALADAVLGAGPVLIVLWWAEISFVLFAVELASLVFRRSLRR